MTSLSTVLLVFVPLVVFYISNAVAIGTLLDGACTDTSNCTTVPSSECSTTKKTCQCLSTHYKHNSTTCAPKIGYNGACLATSQCKEVNTTCQTKCICIASHFRDSSSCEPLITPSKSCGAKGNSSCVDNAYCNHTSTGFCVCGVNFHASSTSCNSAVTMAVVEISTLILCFMVAYLEVLK